MPPRCRSGTGSPISTARGTSTSASSASRSSTATTTDRWLRLGRGSVELHLAEGEGIGDPEGEAIVTLDVEDVKAEAERLREAGVEVGTVLEIPSTIRLLDVYDPDGNRLQLSQDL